MFNKLRPSEVTSLKEQYPQYDWSDKSFCEDVIIFDSSEELYRSLKLLPNHESVLVIKTKSDAFELKYIYINAVLTDSEIEYVDEHMSHTVSKIVSGLKSQDIVLYASIEQYADNHMDVIAPRQLIENYMVAINNTKMKKMDILDYMIHSNPDAIQLNTGRIIQL